MAQLLQATWVLALRDGWRPPWLDAHTSTLTDWNRFRTHRDTAARKVLGS
jgi:hypothetical protein